MRAFLPKNRPFQLILLSVFLSISLVTGVFGEDEPYNPFCPWLLQPQGSPVAVAEAVAARAKIIERLKTGHIPAFLKDTPNGPVPVLQMNKTTAVAAEMNDFLTNSLGVQVFLQPDWRNDHGSFRLGEYMIDVDTPGARGVGEIYKTGLSWKKLSDYLPRRQESSNVILEVAYSLSPAEMKIAQTYQRMRRAAIIRVPFTFGGNAVDRALPNLLLSGGEHCFLFCSGSQLSRQIAEIRENLVQFKLNDIDAFLNAEETKEFIQRSDNLMLSASIVTGGLSPKTLDSLDTANMQKVASAMGAEIPIEKRLIFLNWVYGMVSSQRYEKLFRELQISGNIGVEDASHPRASAILIYSTERHAAEFQGATFQAKGIFTNWTSNGVRPLSVGELK